ncbi:MAG: polymer-forming cytoskeletal protein [Acidobacteriota bacterium]
MLKRTASQGELNGFLDAGSHIRGELHFEDTFRIDGKLTGKISSEGDLVIGEKGEVDGEIDVRRVFVSGTVQGTLRAAERLEITSTGRVTADLHAPTLIIESGAYFQGTSSMGAEGREAVASQSDSATSGAAVASLAVGPKAVEA